MPDFLQSSREVALRFLQTVVIVDDGAYIVLEEHPDSVISELKTPGRGDRQLVEGASAGQERAQRELDAKAVIDSFAEYGLICAVLRPREDEKITDSTLKCSERADVLVLDWKLKEGEEGGETTREIIRRTIESDAGQNGRLRLIAVYTAEADLKGIVEQIRDDLPVNVRESVNELDGGFALRLGSTLITVYSKEDVDPSSPERSVSESDLPIQLIDAFTQLTSGLVSNVALASLSALRDGTHHILNRLHSDLDIPYLSHRALLSQPDDAVEHVVSLVTSEVRALLDYSDVGAYANLSSIKERIDMLFDNSASATFSHPEASSEEISLEKLLSLLELGLESFDPDMSSKTKSEKFKKALRGKPSELFKLGAAEAHMRDLEYARLTTLRGKPSVRNYADNSSPLILDLGTILRSTKKTTHNEGDHAYWLCIQPKCDCVRIDREGRRFPFLPLEVVEQDANKKFTFVVRDPDENDVRLKLVDKPYELKMVHFKPGAGVGVVHAKNEGSTFVFNSEMEGSFIWIDDLKFEFAQKVSNDFAAQIARVGVNPSEWLRLISK